MDSKQRSEDQEHHSLKGGERRPAQNLAEHDDGAADGSDQHGQQEALVAVLDERHHGEDRGEQHDHHQRAGEEEIEIVLAGAAVAERGADARAEDDPEKQRRSDDSHHAADVAIEAHNFAAPQGEHGHHAEAADSRRRGGYDGIKISSQEKFLVIRSSP
jgi:hypothetical protein